MAFVAMSVILTNIWRKPLKSIYINNCKFLLAGLSTSVSEKARTKPQDTILVKLKSALGVGDVLAAVQTHLPVMSYRHMVHALTCLFQIQKANKNEIDAKMIVKDPAFGLLCQNLNKHAREMEVGDIIDAIKALSYLKVPADSLIVETLLQMVRCNINMMNIQQIMFLDFVLSQFEEKSHLVDALKLALPLSFQIQLPLELDNQDLPLLRDMLLFACSHKLPDRCINNIVTGLLLHDQTITAAMAKSVIWALCQINCTEEKYPTRRQLFGICCDIMVQRMNQYSYDDVLRTAARLKARILDKHPEYYHEQWMDAAANYVIQKNLDFEKALLLARVLSRIAHTHLGLVAYLCTKAASNADTLKNARANILIGFINCLSNNNYTPEKEQWHELKAQISASPILNASSALPWTKICLELASLNFYVDKVLQRVFSKEFLDRYLSREDNVLDYLQLLTLYEAVRTFHSDQYELPREIIEKAKKLYPLHALSEPVVEHLSRGLGGPEYVARNIVLPSGIVSDVMVCIKGGCPLKITSHDGRAKLPIEELNLPPGTLVVCIINFNQGCYSMNSNRLRGVFRLILDILEKQGYATVAFNINEWLNMPAHERTPYLMREIGYRCSEMGIKLSAT